MKDKNMKTILQDIRKTITLATKDNATKEQLNEARDQCTTLIKHFVDDGR